LYKTNNYKNVNKATKNIKLRGKEYASRNESSKHCQVAARLAG